MGVCLHEWMCMLLCDLSACDSRLANVRSVVSRSSNKPFSERDFTASERAGAGAGTCCMLEHWNIFTFHLGSWWWNRKVFNLDINSVRTGTACFGFFYTDKQTDRDRWIHAYMIDAILCNICHFSTDPWLQFVNNTQVECHIFFQHSHKCPIYRIRTRQTERWLLNYSVTERQLPW